MDSQHSIAVHNISDVKEELHSSQQPATTSSPVNPQPMEGLQGTGPPPFLTKTYDMVEDPITNAVVSWSTTNNSFIVWNSHQFSLDLLPKYFKHNNFSSFVRQLNTYGFRKVHPDRWEFANEGFLRGQKHLLKHIHRRKPPSQGQQQQQGVGACIEVGQFGMEGDVERLRRDKNVLMVEVVKLRQQQQSTKSQLQVMGQRLQATEQRQQQMMTFLARAMQNPTFLAQLVQHSENNGKRLASNEKKKKRRLTQHQHQLPTEAEGNESSSDGHEIVKYNKSNTPISSDSVKPHELVMQDSKYLHSMLFSGMENSIGAGEGNEVPHSNSTGESSMAKHSLDNDSRNPQSVAETDQLAKDNEMGGLPFENSYSLEMALQGSDKFASQEGDTANITEAHPPPPPPPHQDLDFKSSSDVFWEELLNENFDSQEDSEAEAEAEVDGDFPDYDKAEDSSIGDTSLPWDERIDVNTLAEQMGKMGHIPSRSKPSNNRETNEE